uniref:ATP-dependent DNA helicase n=1 Tax=Amphimedon queenslandica TaxID=400682 RepID=A0A1X7VBE3_AMPQE
MLRRNIDVTVGLVIGAIGAVMFVDATRTLIKFDHIDALCDIKSVTSRFMLSKNLYIHRKQFFLILSYAITIHKCQGLLLDTAIIDLLTDVFGDGMAYVALSCLLPSNGLHLLSFDPLFFLILVIHALKKLTALELNFEMIYHKSRKVKERRERLKWLV